jgi:GLEYA domain
MSLHEPLEGSGGTNPTIPGTAYLTAAASGINAAYGVRGTPYNPGGNVSTVTNSATGLYREKYIGNPWITYNRFDQFDVTWFDDPSRGPIGVDIYSYAGFGQRKDLGSMPTVEDGYTLQWRGYFQAPATGTYNIWTSGTDDDAAVWIGTAALNPTYANMNGYASNNRVLSINSVNLTAGQWYPVRMVFTEFTGWEQCQWFIQDSTHSVLYGGLDLSWAYNTVTKGY